MGHYARATATPRAPGRAGPRVTAPRLGLQTGLRLGLGLLLGLQPRLGLGLRPGPQLGLRRRLWLQRGLRRGLRLGLYSGLRLGLLIGLLLGPGATVAGAQPAPTAPAQAPAPAGVGGQQDLADMLSRANKARRERTAGGQAAAAPTGLTGSTAGAPLAMPAQAEATGSLWRIVTYSALIAALILGAAFGIRRWQRAQLGGKAGNQLELEEALWVGRGQRVLLLRVGDLHVLVGQSGGNFENLGSFELPSQPLPVASELPSEPQPRAPSRLPTGIPTGIPGGAEPRGAAEHFASMVQDELVEQAKERAPRRSRSRVLERLNNI